MAKIQIHFLIDVEVPALNGHSSEALWQGYYIVRDLLADDKRIGKIYQEGISKVY